MRHTVLVWLAVRVARQPLPDLMQRATYVEAARPR
jgi:hypothetical protein